MEYSKLERIIQLLDSTPIEDWKASGVFRFENHKLGIALFNNDSLHRVDLIKMSDFDEVVIVSELTFNKDKVGNLLSLYFSLGMRHANMLANKAAKEMDDFLEGVLQKLENAQCEEKCTCDIEPFCSAHLA